MSTLDRSLRYAALACATQWLVVGLQLADLVRGVESSTQRHVKIVMLVLFALGGMFSLMRLWDAQPPRPRPED